MVHDPAGAGDPEALTQPEKHLAEIAEKRREEGQEEGWWVTPPCQRELEAPRCSDMEAQARGAGIHPELTWSILGCAFEVHRALGPGLLEATYRRCLVHELQLKSLQVAAEVPISLAYKGLQIDSAYRADLIVEKTCLVELKAVEQLAQVHKLQVLTYLRLARLPVGLLINFNAPRLKDGIRRFVNT